MHLLEAQRMPQGGPAHCTSSFRGEPALQDWEVFQLEWDELQFRDGTRAGCGHAECLAQVIGEPAFNRGLLTMAVLVSA